MSSLLDATAILAAFAQLDRVLERRGLTMEAFVVGGAAIALSYDGRRSTVDVDAAFAPPDVRGAIEEAGEQLGLPPDWLNDAVKGFLPGMDPEAVTRFEGSALRVTVASPRYLLAMKLAAARYDTDVNDIVTLGNILGIRSANDAIAVVTSYYPPASLQVKTRYLAQEIFGPGEQRK